jgi:NitT/TauT family transport system permease protein
MPHGLEELSKLRREPPAWLRYLLALVGIGLVLGIWFWVTRGASEQRLVSASKMPSPEEAWARVAPLFKTRDLMGHLLVSLERVFSGFGLAVLVGVPLGILAASWRALEAFLSPVVLFGRNVPIGALVPLTFVLFGLGEKQMRMFIFIATVPFVFSATVAAVVQIPERFVETARTLGASRLQVVWKVLVPLALPDIITNLRFLFGLAWGYIMLAEVGGVNQGVGFLLNQSQTRGGDQGDIYIILLAITIIAFLIDRILHWVQRGVFQYRTDL